MKIGVIGATGRIGQRIVAEAVSRGHDVTAFTSDPSKIPADGGPNVGKVAWKTADVLNTESVSQAMQGQDVLISSFGPGMGKDPQPIAAAADVLLKAAEKHPSTRLLVVGGAGSLEVAPGKTVLDAGMIPPEWVAVPKAHQEALDKFRANTTAQWTFFSPAAMIQPGVRTGKFRMGGDQLIVGENGKSEISMEDYAIAMIDEAEKPQHTRKRFTIGY